MKGRGIVLDRHFEAIKSHVLLGVSGISEIGSDSGPGDWPRRSSRLCSEFAAKEPGLLRFFSVEIERARSSSTQIRMNHLGCAASSGCGALVERSKQPQLKCPANLGAGRYHSLLKRAQKFVV